MGGSVGAFGVVDAAEGVELGLHVGEVGGSRSWVEPAFEGLVEAFDAHYVCQAAVVRAYEFVSGRGRLA